MPEVGVGRVLDTLGVRETWAIVTKRNTPASWAWIQGWYSGPQFEIELPVHPKMIIMELSSSALSSTAPWEFMSSCQRVEPSWLSNSHSTAHCGKRPLSTAPVISCMHPRGPAWTIIYLVGFTGCPAHAGAGWTCLWSFVSSLGQCALSETNVSATAQSCAWMNNPARTALASPSVSASMAQLICQLNKLYMDNRPLAVHSRKWTYLAHYTVIV